ncbi:hypothetical protein [uncultured Thomasclavelia sp.]|uniref:hypothetical protein n=1 Tax=uncultured Thomasclavelia sp. TaxID=3025759 RepID=UPI002616CFE4|nr:hypothetical protein [uncultured Thomasclavelia sp.]
MRKIFAIFGLVLFITLLTACSPEFNGSSTGNDTQFIMEYSILNKSDYRNMTLKSGDIINTSIVSDSGSVSIEVENSKGEIIYSDEDIPTSDFEIAIPQDDTYKFTVTGHNAKGSVKFILENVD